MMLSPHFALSEFCVSDLAAVRDSGIPFDQLILEYARNGGGWVHMSFTDHPRRMALEIDSQGTRPLA